MKLTEPDAETVSIALRTLISLMAEDEAIQAKALGLSGWAIGVESDYVSTLSRLASYIETVQKAG